MVLAPMIWRHRAEFMHLERPWLQLLRVTLSTLEVAAFFLATVYLPLADVITYYLACPVFVTALSAIVLREHVGWRRWSAVLIGFCGVLIALRPSSQTVSWPAVIALGGSLSFAVLMLITRSLRATPDIVLASSQFVGTFALGALMSPFGWVTPSIGSLGLFAAAGCISVSALLCVNRSLKLAPASVVVPYQYSMIVWAVMFGYVVFGDVPSDGDDRGCCNHHRRGVLYFPARARTRARGDGGQSAGGLIVFRHCGRSEAIHENATRLDCFVASLLAMTVTLPLAPRRAAPVLQRRPDAAREAEAIDRGRGTQRLEAMQLDAAPLEAAFLQNVARGRVGDPCA